MGERVRGVGGGSYASERETFGVDETLDNSGQEKTSNTTGRGMTGNSSPSQEQTKITQQSENNRYLLDQKEIVKERVINNNPDNLSIPQQEHRKHPESDYHGPAVIHTAHGPRYVALEGAIDENPEGRRIFKVAGTGGTIAEGDFSTVLETPAGIGDAVTGASGEDPDRTSSPEEISPVPEKYRDQNGNYDPMLEYVDRLYTEDDNMVVSRDRETKKNGESEEVGGDNESLVREATPEVEVPDTGEFGSSLMGRLSHALRTVRQKSKDIFLRPVTGFQTRWQSAHENLVDPESVATEYKRLFAVVVGAVAIYGVYRYGPEIYDFFQGNGETVNGPPTNTPSPESIPGQEAVPTDISAELGLPEGYIINTPGGYEVTAVTGSETNSIWRAAEHALRDHLTRQPTILETDALQDILGTHRLNPGDKVTISKAQINNALEVASQY